MDRGAEIHHISGKHNMLLLHIYVYYCPLPETSSHWNTVCGAIQDLPWRNIWLADIPVDVPNHKNIQSCVRW